MAEITINGVKYTNVPNKKAGTKFAASLTQSNIGASQAVQDYVNSAYFYPLVNAIDINWNGVEVDENSYINSTSDLITYIATKGSNVDLTSYATKNYVDQKIEDVIGGAPETLDTLKELADALEDDASLAYVTEALAGKADVNNVYTKQEVDNLIPAPVDLSSYATTSYVTTELDKKADKTDIPSMPDLTNYVSYTDANSYYMTVTGPKQVINSPKTFVGNKLINFRQGTSTDKLGFTLYNNDEKEAGGFEWRPDTIDGKPLMSLQHYVNAANMSIIPQSYLGFRQTQGNNKYHLLAPIPADVATIETITSSNYKNFFIPLVFKNGSNKVYTNCTGLVDMASLMPDLNDYTTTSYVTTELDKKADKTDIVQADMCETDTTSKSYVLNNPYQYHLYTWYGSKYYCYNLIIPHNTNFDNTNILNSNIKNCVIIGNNHNIYNALQSGLIQGYKNKIQNDFEVAFGQFNSSTRNISDGSLRTVFSIGNGDLVSRHNALEVKGDGQIYIADTKDGTPYSLQTKLNSKADLSYVTTELANKANLSDIPATPDLTPYATVSYVTTELDKKANVSDIPTMPDMTQYVTMTSYNALYEEVQHLAYLISYYHPTPDPTPTPTPTFEGYWTYNGMRTDSLTISTSDPNMTLSFVSNPTISSGIGTWNFYDMPSSGITINSSTGEMTINPSLLSEGSVYSSVGYMYQNNGESTSFYITITVTSSTPTKIDPYSEWTVNGMTYHNSISISPSQGLTTLTFSGYPASGWTFTDPMISGITVDTSTGSITVSPSYASAGTYYVSVSYPGDATYNSYSGTFTITVESGKQSAIGNWYDTNNIMTSNKAVVSGDTTTYTFTFQSTPASGWSFSDPMMSGITVDQSNGSITIDPSGMPDSAYPINVTASYMEDSSYWGSMASFSIRVLPVGANPDFYYESSSINLSNTMPSQSPMIHSSLTYDHIDYLSTDTSVATVNNYGTIEYVGPGTCTVQATALDSNDSEIAYTIITVYCTQSKQMTSFQWYDSNNMTVYQYVVNLGGSGTEVFHYDATPADGWTVSGDNGTSIVLDTTLKTLTIDKSSLSVRGNNAIVATRDEDSSYYSGMNVFNVTVIPAGESANFYFQTQGVSLSPSFSTMSLMLNNSTGIDTMQYPINYSSSDTSVATVDNYGMVTYVANGDATITATLSDGNNTYTATAEVNCWS